MFEEVKEEKNNFKILKQGDMTRCRMTSNLSELEKFMQKRTGQNLTKICKEKQKR